MIFNNLHSDYRNVLEEIVTQITTNSSWELVSNFTDNDYLYPELGSTNFWNRPNYSNQSTYTGWGVTGSDGYVLKSIPLGPYQRSLYIRLKYMDKVMTYNNSQYMWLNGYHSILVELMEEFTPNEDPTVLGTKSLRRTRYMQHMINHTIGPGTDIMYYLDVEDHRIIMAFERNDNDVTLKRPTLMYLGYPKLDTVVETKSLIPSLVVSSDINHMSNSNSQGVLLNTYSSKANDGACPTSSILSPKNPNPLGTYTMSPITVQYGGYNIGELDGIFALPAVAITQSDIIMQDGKMYQIFDVDQVSRPSWNYNTNSYTMNNYYWNSQFPSRFIAMQIG
jgi:hypothetical protein